MKKDTKLQLGDIFSIKTENSGAYIYGRVLFDTQKQFTEGMPFNYLDWHSKSVLIEMYKYVTIEEAESINIDTLETAITSTFIDKNSLQKRLSRIIANKKIDFQKVTFPETLKNVHREGKFLAVGELVIKIDLTIEDLDRINVFPTLGNLYYLELATLDYSGRSDLIEDKEDILGVYFTSCDLRSLPEIRKEIYNRIGENPDLSYHELSSKHGFDFERFYKSN